jgi:tetratricopeptide (TPR) repeat protein
MLSTGRAADSLGRAEEANRVEPSNIAVRLALVRSLLAVQDVARARKEIAPLLAQRPDVAEVQVLAGILAVVENNPSGGRAAFERALTSNPNSLEAVAGLIALDLREKNVTAALKRIDDRLKTNNSAEWLLLAAQTYGSARDMASAERFLRQAIESDATLLTAYEMLGRLYLSQSRLDEARKEFDTLAAKQSKPVAALTMSGMILQSQGQIAEARRRFESALVIEPRAPVAANNLAWLQVEAGENLDVALQLAQSAVSVSPDTPEITDTLGWIYYKKNLPQQAIQQFERSVARAPENAMFRYHLGLAYLQAGDIERGRAALLRALSSKPDTKLAADIKRALPGSGGASSNN